MSTISQTPTYNLKAVLKETGLKADVLRAWERRYELPKPQRTPGGHRLYSEYDIETLKWLRARQDEGLSISRAVELWKETIDQGIDPLVKYSSAHHPTRSHPPVADARIETLRQNWLEAALNFDGAQADEILSQAFAIYPVETVCNQIIQQGIGEIGNYWYLDQASVQQEHFASALASRRLETLITAAPEPTRKQTILIGCPSGEQHTLPVLMFSLLLQRRGFKVVYLGANIPTENLEETIASIQPDLTILAAQQLSTAATLQTSASILQKQSALLAYGGLIFNRIPRLRERIPAYFLGESLDEAMILIEHITTDTQSFPPVEIKAAGKIYQDLARLYQERRPTIESIVLKAQKETDRENKHIDDANFFFGNGIAAALDLGDITYLEADLEWLQRLLTGRKIPTGGLKPYLLNYHDAIHQAMNAAGKPIMDWITAYISHQKEDNTHFSDIIGGA